VTVAKALDYPDLYKSLQKGRELNLKTFLSWLWKSIYQVKKEGFFINFSILLCLGGYDYDTFNNSL